MHLLESKERRKPSVSVQNSLVTGIYLSLLSNRDINSSLLKTACLLGRVSQADVRKTPASFQSWPCKMAAVSTATLSRPILYLKHPSHSKSALGPSTFTHTLTGARLEHSASSTETTLDGFIPRMASTMATPREQRPPNL